MSQPMRVLMLSKALVTGVYQRKLEELAALPGVELLAVVPPRWIEKRVGALELERRFTSGYELVVEPMRFNGNHHLHVYPGLGRQIRRFRPDIVHIDEEPYNLVTTHATWLARRAGARTLFFTWQNLQRRYPPPFRQMEQYAYRHNPIALAGNQDAVQVLRAKGYRGDVEVIPQFGIDPALYTPATQRSERPFTIGYLGRIVPEKGVGVLLAALAEMQPTPRAVIIGNGSELEVLRSQATALGISAQVEFRPGVPAEQVPAALAEMDVLVVPSLTRPNWKEQFGRIIVEAMACEVPVVGSDSGEIPQVIGDAGVVTAEGDASALATALSALRDDPVRRRALGVAARQRVLQRYTQAQIASQTHAVYERLLALPRG